jgi:hypothetical protein
MDYDVITKPREAIALARDLKRCKLGAVDSETEGLDRFKQKNILLQISDGKRIWVIDRRTAGIEMFKPWLEDGSVEKILHNSFFDCCWLKWEFNIHVRNIYDTMYGERVMLGVVLPNKPDPKTGLTMARLNELKPHYSAALTYCLERRQLPAKFEFEPYYWFEPYFKMELKRILKRPNPKFPPRLKIAAQEYPEFKTKYKILAQVNGSELYKIKDSQLFYAARDVENLHTLREDQMNKCAQLDLLNVLDLENRLCEITYMMSHSGMGCDSQRWLDYTAENEAVYNGYLDQLRGYADINWNAPAQVCKFFGVKYIAELEQFEEATSYFKLAK